MEHFTIMSRPVVAILLKNAITLGVFYTMIHWTLTTVEREEDTVNFLTV